MDKLVSIWKDEQGLWVTHSKRLNVGFEGKTEKQALLRFFRFFISDYLVYKYTPQEKMSKGAKKLLRVYRRFIDEEKR